MRTICNLPSCITGILPVFWCKDTGETPVIPKAVGERCQDTDVSNSL